MSRSSFALEDFDYELPPHLVAQRPLLNRAESRLMALDAHGLQHRAFTDLLDFLRPGDRVVLNDTKVLRARLTGSKATGGKVEILVERVESERVALVQLRSSKASRENTLLLAGNHTLQVCGRVGEFYRVAFPIPVYELLESVGEMPIPPYIERSADELDASRYQTVYASEPGAVAAPTAGLHFSRRMLETMESAGVRVCKLTLHVGAGTFQPVRRSDISRHRMHSERYSIPNATRSMLTGSTGRVLAVGTTSLRALEAAALTGQDRGETNLFITPGFQFRVVDALLTNFHLPRSTLLMLVCAFGGHERVMNAYSIAIQSRYRFYSYGDAMLVVR